MLGKKLYVITRPVTIVQYIGERAVYTPAATGQVMATNDFCVLDSSGADVHVSEYFVIEGEEVLVPLSEWNPNGL